MEYDRIPYNGKIA